MFEQAEDVGGLAHLMAETMQEVAEADQAEVERLRAADKPIDRPLEWLFCRDARVVFAGEGAHALPSPHHVVMEIRHESVGAWFPGELTVRDD